MLARAHFQPSMEGHGVHVRAEVYSNTLHSHCRSNPNHLGLAFLVGSPVVWPGTMSVHHGDTPAAQQHRSRSLLIVCLGDMARWLDTVLSAKHTSLGLVPVNFHAYNLSLLPGLPRPWGFTTLGVTQGIPHPLAPLGGAWLIAMPIWPNQAGQHSL